MCVDECVYTCRFFLRTQRVVKRFAYTPSIRRYKVSFFHAYSRVLNINVVHLEFFSLSVSLLL